MASRDSDVAKSEAEILKQLEVGAIDVRSVGTEIAERIKSFEAWLNTIPGRVQATVEVCTDAELDEYTNLTFRKDGKGWSFFIYTYDARFDHYGEVRALRDATLEEKLWAVRHFDQVLPAMAKAQADLVQRAKQAAQAYDDLAKSLGIKEGA